MNDPAGRPAPKIEHFDSADDASGRPTYRGLPEFAHPGLHARVAERAGEIFKPGGRVLDLGCGSGALTLRLADAGFRMQAADALSSFRPSDEIPFRTVDLNDDFAKMFEGGFDGVTAVEIIEHLENPRHFLRQIRALLKPGGRAIVTTPNLDTPRSVLNFIKTGCFKYFDDACHANDGHITPISQWQMEKAAQDAAFRILSFEGVGEPYGPGLRHLGAKTLRLLARRNPRIPGVIVMVSLEKPAA